MANWGRFDDSPALRRGCPQKGERVEVIAPERVRGKITRNRTGKPIKSGGCKTASRGYFSFIAFTNRFPSL